MTFSAALKPSTSKVCPPEASCSARDRRIIRRAKGKRDGTLNPKPYAPNPKPFSKAKGKRDIRAGHRSLRPVAMIRSVDITNERSTTKGKPCVPATGVFGVEVVSLSPASDSEKFAILVCPRNSFLFRV